MKSRLLPSLLLALGMASADNVSAIVVGAIDFGVMGNTSHIETGSFAETIVTATGQTVIGYGVINSVNTLNLYCGVDPNCRLFFSFTYNVVSFSLAHVEFANGVVNIFYDSGTPGAGTGKMRNLLNFSSPTNIAYINSLPLWVQLIGHNNFGSGGCTVPGATLCYDFTPIGLTTFSFTGQGLLDVNLGAPGLASLEAFWNGNGVPDLVGGFADISLTQLGDNLMHNPNDVCTNPPLAGQFCVQGGSASSALGTIGTSAESGLTISGPTRIPEPGTLLLLTIGMGRFAFGALRPKKASVARMQRSEIRGAATAGGPAIRCAPCRLLTRLLPATPRIHRNRRAVTRIGPAADGWRP
jgi:hypothetical protein